MEPSQFKSFFQLFIITLIDVQTNILTLKLEKIVNSISTTNTKMVTGM